MRRMRRLGVAGLAVVAILASYGVLSAQDRGGARANEEKPLGKFVVVASVWKGGLLILEKPVVRRHEGRTFLVGRHAGDGSKENAFEGMMAWVPYESVTAMFEFETAEAAQKAF